MYRNLNDYEILYLVSENDDLDYNLLLRKYKPLITKIVCKYVKSAKRYGLEYDDLMQIGYMALIDATKHYKDSLDVLFYTYLIKLINNRIINEFRKNDTFKRKTLNDSISYDIIVPNTNFSYLDLFVDINSDFSTNNYITYEYKMIAFKNSLSFDMSCVFELKYNGYSDKEISQLLSITLNDVREKIKLIKGLFLYI